MAFTCKDKCRNDKGWEKQMYKRGLKYCSICATQPKNSKNLKFCPCCGAMLRITPTNVKAHHKIVVKRY